jgi:hypothetical protein
MNAWRREGAMPLTINRRIYSGFEKESTYRLLLVLGQWYYVLLTYTLRRACKLTREEAKGTATGCFRTSTTAKLPAISHCIQASSQITVVVDCVETATCEHWHGSHRGHCNHIQGLCQ